MIGCLVAASLFFLPGTAQAGPIRTAFVDGAVQGPARPEVIARSQAAGATMIRIDLLWHAVAPATRPPTFSPENPNDPAYNWASFDQTITAAVAAGLEPIVSVVWTPVWAQGAGSGPTATVRPNPVEFGRFARAAAHRYSGSFVPDSDPGAEPLPRVRNWMAWNEPNRGYFLSPQFEGGKLVSGIWYRKMVSQFAAQVHAVNPSNVVIAGGLAPLGRPKHPAPLRFMRSMLCLTVTLKRACDLRSNPVRLNVWSHHPYTSGGPTHKAARRDDVALGDLPKMKRVLKAAIRLGHVRSPKPVAFWVTEFSWDSKPPDPRALPAALHARWVSEALYRMWRHNVQVVTWFKIQDDPLTGPGSTPYQSGFWTVKGSRKRSLTAFRFPTVGFKRSNGIYVWGRSPTSTPGPVVVDIKVGRKWRRLGTVRANASGIFKKTYRTPIRKGYVRARFGGENSLPFSLTPVRDRYVNPFGCGGAIRC